MWWRENMTTLAAVVSRVDLVTMLAELGGPAALREDFLRDKSYRNHPIGELAGRYLDALAFDNYARGTLDSREHTLSWLTFDYPTLRPEDVTYDLLRAFLEEHWRDSSRNTKAGHISGLRCFFEWAHDNDVIPKNPARRLKAPRRSDTERRAHPQETIRKLVVAQEMRRDQVAILLMYWCALRRNELRQVQFRHMDLGRRALTVFGKGGRVTEQNIPEPIALDLERHILDRQVEPDEYLLYPLKIGRVGGWPTYRYDVCWEDRFRPLTLSAIDKWWQRCRARAGLDDIVMHELRHSAGTHMQEAGHDLIATQEFMRHASAATTERDYIHIDRRAAVARVQRQMRDVMDEGTA